MFERNCFGIQVRIGIGKKEVTTFRLKKWSGMLFVRCESLRSLLAVELKEIKGFL